MLVTCQGQNGKFYQVDLDGRSCTCTGYLSTKKDCYHIRTATDVYQNGGKMMRFDLMSLFHKEIRRSDVRRGVFAARSLARISGAPMVKKYCSNIIFEECRNLDLFEKYQQGTLDDKEHVRSMIRTRKKWELPYMADHFEDWNEAFHNFSAHLNEVSRLDLDWMMEKIMSYSTPVEAYEILFVIQSNKDFDGWFWAKLAERANRDNNELLKRYLGFKPDHYYGRMVGLELGIGYWSKEANDYVPDVEVGPTYLPNCPDYVYDCHHYRGRERLLKVWPTVMAMKPEGRVDLRWSGQLFGIYWRFKCHQQNGSMVKNDKDIDWLDVKLEDSVWQQIPLHDSYYYTKMYAMLRKAGNDVPIWKVDHGKMSMEDAMAK